MKVAWFTPFTSRSAIGRFSALVVAELSKYVPVDLWYPEFGDTIELAAGPQPVRPRPFQSPEQVNLHELRDYDVLVYNLGNHLPYHREIYLLSQLVPGLVITHDLVMHHFFATFYIHYLNSTELYVKAMVDLYGEAGRKAAQTALPGGGPVVWETDEVLNFDFLPAITEGAYGVITHSEYCRKAVAAVFQGPVFKIPLPYEPKAHPTALSRQELGLREDDALLVTVGHVNPNKRIHVVLEVLSRLARDWGGRFVYVVMGVVNENYHLDLNAYMQAAGLQGQVRFLGYTDARMLHSYLTHADVCINLRFPPMEGASATAIEQMWYGKAIAVTDTGFYQELPDDAVCKISPANEQDDLLRALTTLLSEPAQRKRLGARAREVVELRFRTDNYVQQLLQIFDSVQRVKPAFALADRIARELQAMQAGGAMGLAQSVAERTAELFFS